MTRIQLLRKLGERINKIRTEAGLTMDQFGKRIGVTKMAISMWEAGESNPQAWSLYRLASEFNVSPDWLLFGDEP